MSEPKCPNCIASDTFNAQLAVTLLAIANKTELFCSQAVEYQKAVKLEKTKREKINAEIKKGSDELVKSTNKLKEDFIKWEDKKNAEVTDLKEKLKKSETNRRNDQQKLRDSLEKNRQLEHELAQGEDY